MSVADTDAMGEELWFLGTEFDAPQKDLSFPSTPLGQTLSTKASVNSLHIRTYPKANLPERYNSDEEEASPSPDNSDTASVYEELEEEGEEAEEELKHKSTQRLAEEDDDLVVCEAYSAEIAVAVPIMIMGPPKLVDITKLAPIQRRPKRPINHPTLQRAAMKNAGALSSRSPSFPDHSAPTAPSRTAPTVPKAGTPSSSKASSPTVGEHPPKRQDSLPDLARMAPESWLPDDDSDTILESVEEQSDLYFPTLEVRPSPTYHDYDPYSLNPPSLSPRSSSSISHRSTPTTPTSPHKKQPGSIARARKTSNPPRSLNNNNNGSWKGLTRVLSTAKHQEPPRALPQAKKPKMVARGATERQEMPSIPPFPFEEKTLAPRLSTNVYAGSTTALSLKA